LPADPSIVSGLSGRYAIALFELAEEQDQLDRVAQDLSALSGLMAESAELSRLIASPMIKRSAQAAALRAVADKAGLSALTANFLGTVARNRRLSSLTRMIGDYQRLLARHRGQISAQLTSAQALSEGQRSALKDKLKAATGRDVMLDESVDPALIGGLVVQIGSRRIDASLKTKLDQVEHAMKGM